MCSLLWMVFHNLFWLVFVMKHKSNTFPLHKIKNKKKYPKKKQTNWSLHYWQTFKHAHQTTLSQVKQAVPSSWTTTTRIILDIRWVPGAVSHNAWKRLFSSSAVLSVCSQWSCRQQTKASSEKSWYCKSSFYQQSGVCVGRPVWLELRTSLYEVTRVRDLYLQCRHKNMSWSFRNYDVVKAKFQSPWFSGFCRG